MLLYLIAYDFLNTLYAVEYLDFDRHNKDFKNSNQIGCTLHAPHY